MTVIRVCAAAALAAVLAAPAFAGFDAGVAAYQRGDFEAAVREFEPAAEAGDAAAQFTLGTMHPFGEGAPKDDVAAYMWLDLAARAGAWCRGSSRIPS